MTVPKFQRKDLIRLWRADGGSRDPACRAKKDRYLNGSWIDVADCLMRRTLTGVPSETNSSSYRRPSLSVAEQVISVTFLAAKLPVCRQVPVDGCSAGTGSPSTLGRSLELSSMRSIGSW